VREGERVIVTRHGHSNVEIVPAKLERKDFNFEVLRKWRRDRSHVGTGWVANDFYDPLLEDFIMTPQDGRW
jgi:antitoxin (DNA-binding transcriptional repressor) of toxin-antitoxin stability system